MICPLPSSPELLKNIMSHPHGRRMVAGILMLDHVCEEKPLPHEFLLAWRVIPIDERAAFRKILENSPCPAQREQTYIEEGLMESCRPGDGFFQYFSKLVRTPHEASLLNAAGRWIDLADPAITPEAVRELASTPDIPRSSLAALAANPNFPKDLFLKVLVDNICFQVAYCKHGNFKDKSMLIRLLPKRESEIIFTLCPPSFHSRHRCRTSCDCFPMTLRVRRTWRSSGGPTDSSVITVGGMANRADSRTDPLLSFDAAIANVTHRSRPTRSCSAHTHRSRFGFGPPTLWRAKHLA